MEIFQLHRVVEELLPLLGATAALAAPEARAAPEVPMAGKAAEERAEPEVVQERYVPVG